MSSSPQSYLRRGAETIEAALQAQKYEAGFYKNGAKLTGILYTETDLTSRPEIAQPDGTKISIKDAIRREWELLADTPQAGQRGEHQCKRC